MKEIPLTKGKVSLIDDEDFEKVSKFHWAFDGRYARSVFKRPSAKRKRDPRGQTNIYLHRFILGLYDENFNSIPRSRKEVDHINRNKLDNRKENLRLITSSQNKVNQPKRNIKKATSVFKGVSFYKSGNYTAWAAKITAKDKYINLGYYDTEKDAARAYNAAAKLIHGEYVILNTL